MNGELKKHITLIPLILYGVGTILGAGIYVIISEVANASGSQFPLSFVIASIVAIFAGLSYAELSSRFPKSAGEVVYVKQAFDNKFLNTLVGYAVALTGMVTSATILKGFHGYLNVFVSSPGWLSISVMILLLALVAIKGIKESVLVISLITLIEISGLFLVIYFGSAHIDKLPELIQKWKEIGFNSSIFIGAFIAFFAYVGFEDMVNTAEEVIDAPNVLPKAITWAIVISTVIYFMVSLICSLALPLEVLKTSNAPLVLVIEQNSNLSPKIMGVIALVSIVNGALVQLIMVSRMFYGMAKIEVAPKVFSKISSRTNTPIVATIFTASIIWLFAILFPIGNLAKATSLIIICVFILICLSLIKIKLDKNSPKPSFQVSIIIPIIGGSICLLFLGNYLYSQL
ncbi:MAG: amino acid permease [Halobacteriovoraceae bacterium]|jgi:basic amino acid/polyamine antiporter, APA family|nr:amino acid permease [Halobacteriovoraceae bacterium]MBT5095212.1 amino acid permease [Halobacteriovoraceae bacterium]